MLQQAQLSVLLFFFVAEIVYLSTMKMLIFPWKAQKQQVGSNLFPAGFLDYLHGKPEGPAYKFILAMYANIYHSSLQT